MGLEWYVWDKSMKEKVRSVWSSLEINVIFLWPLFIDSLSLCNSLKRVLLCFTSKHAASSSSSKPVNHFESLKTYLLIQKTETFSGLMVLPHRLISRLTAVEAARQYFTFTAEWGSAYGDCPSTIIIRALKWWYNGNDFKSLLNILCFIGAVWKSGVYDLQQIQSIKLTRQHFLFSFQPFFKDVIQCPIIVKTNVKNSFNVRSITLPLVGNVTQNQPGSHKM